MQSVEPVVDTRILGPLEVLVGGEPVALKGEKQRELVAILAIHANEIVSTDRLIDGLWGQDPPPTALKTLHAHVSRLRAALGPAGRALETTGRGYRLRLDEGRLDSEDFRTRLEDGRRALARGEVDAAATLLRDALALWRGPALADFVYADFAQSEISQLEELRLAAIEERVEADLRLGRHAELVVELERLVAEQPLRERPRAQLMLALYRSDRQAEALSVYDDGRRHFAEELGLAPSEGLQQLERRILEHDPALQAPKSSPATPAAGQPGWRRPRALVAAGALLLAIAIGAAVYQGTRGDETIEAAGVHALDPDSGDLVASAALGSAPSDVAVGEGSAWVIDADDRTVSQIDVQTHEVVRTFSTSTTPTDIEVGAGAVWVGNAPSAGSVLPTSISRLDAETGDEVATIELVPAPKGHLYGVFGGVSRQHIAVTDDAVWVINADLTVSRIDPRSNQVVDRTAAKAENIAAGEGDVWITEGNTLAEIDPGTNQISRRIELDEAEGLSDVAVGGGAVWGTDPEGGNLWRVDTGRAARKRAIPLELWVAGVTFGEGAVWTTNEITDEVHRVHPRGRKAELVAGVASPRDVAAADGAVWVTAAQPPSPDAALPGAVCGEVAFEGEGRPDVLLVSSLPLQGNARQDTRPMVDAVRLVLKQRDFEAGAYSVGYQSCDSSTAQAGGEDFFRCGALAKAFSRNLSVVGVFGSYTSYCSYQQIPITNEAPDGPLTMITPSNTHHSLTTDDSLYPTGTRHYFRLAAVERYYGAAQVELARQLGHDRLFVAESRYQEYGPDYVPELRATARELGVEVVGSAKFDPDARSHDAVVREAVASRPESVAIVGILTPGSAALLRQLRRALGPEVAISAPDGFELPDDLQALAGDAANGLYVAVYGIPNALLPPRGKQFLDTFAASSGGDSGPDKSASYGAQAAEILLDAIAHSDGTRQSVREEVQRSEVTNGILGDVAWDARGDLLEGPVEISQMRDGELVVDRVVVVRPAWPVP
jgi:DNA-binding SARP family transcriptional activator/ABC-type branched-subunit amino acid transport system substrate-binding protein/DNA-binding beta-propeller fold protein YncE